MIDIFEFSGEDFKPVMEYKGWKLGLLRYSERFADFKVLERHLLTDEAFVLLEGEASLYLRDDKGDILNYPMEKSKVYNIHQGVWHHIVVSNDATVLVVEDSGTGVDNTQKEEYRC